MLRRIFSLIRSLVLGKRLWVSIGLVWTILLGVSQLQNSISSVVSKEVFLIYETIFIISLAMTSAITLAAIVVALVVGLRSLRKRQLWGNIEPRFVFRILENKEEVRALSHYANLQWPGLCPPLDLSCRIFAKNNATHVGVFDASSDELRGWAEIYPLTPDAAQRLMRGEISDLDLGIDDIVEKRDNATVYDVLLATLCVRSTWDITELGALRMLRALAAHFLEHFVSRNRNVNLMAICFDEGIESLCKKIGMTKRAMIAYPDESHPLYAGVFSRQQLRDLSK